MKSAPSLKERGLYQRIASNVFGYLLVEGESRKWVIGNCRDQLTLSIDLNI